MDSKDKGGLIMNIKVITNSRRVDQPKMIYLPYTNEPEIVKVTTRQFSPEDYKAAYDWAYDEIENFEIPVLDSDQQTLGGYPQIMGELDCIFASPDEKDVLLRHAWTTPTGETHVLYRRILNPYVIIKNSALFYNQFKLNGAFLWLQCTDFKRAQLMAPRH